MLILQKDVVRWLEECRKEAVIYPIVRESISQYINLVKYLTNQTINHTMQKELNDLLLDNLEASFTIADSLDQTLNTLLMTNFTPKLEEACQRLGLLCVNGINFNKNYSGIWIWKEEWQYVNIGFQFWSSDKKLVYGIVCKQDPIKNPLPEQLKTSLMPFADRALKANGWWPVHHEMEEPLDNWEKYQAWKDHKKLTIHI